MSVIKVLSAEAVEQLFTIPMAIEAVERAYLEKHSGQGGTWPMVFHEFDPGHADLDIKSGHLGGAGVYGLKVVSWFGDNPGKGLPALFGTSLVFDLATGAPKALVNAGPITHYRTGAAAAIGAKYLARQDAKELLMVGCGALAPYLIAAMLFVKPDIEQVTLVNPHHAASAAEKRPVIVQKVERLLAQSGSTLSADIYASEQLEMAVRRHRIIITATPSYQPMIEAAWVQPGTHFSCIGSDMQGKQEISSELFRSARIFGDDEGQCLSVGECEIPHKKGILAGLCGEIGAVMAGSIPGRIAPQDITIFDSTGIALQDLVSAADVLAAAARENVGVDVEL